MTAPAFSLAALQARIAATRIAPPAPIVQGFATIQRKDAARNPRALQSIIEESGELDVHTFDPFDNRDSLAVSE